ncbi:MAG: cyclic nucleotide-binding domain-containing protein [Thermodesulfobacteriota bacterium]
MVEKQLDLLTKRLKSIDTFRLFSEAEIKAHLLPACIVKQFKAGDAIIKEGAIGSHAFFIISGHVKAVKRGVSLFQMQRRGDVFGEEAVIDGSPAPAAVIAVKDTTCLALAARLVGSLKDDSLGKFHSILYRVFAEKLAERLRESDVIIAKLKEEILRLRKAGGAAAAPGPPGGRE